MNAWTDEQLTEFDRLTRSQNSNDLMKRIFGRIDMMQFLRCHGQQKCCAMYAHLTGQ